MLSFEAFERDTRTESVVEVNFRNASARIVQASDAPTLTEDVLRTKGTPVKTVELFFDGDIYQVRIKDGEPLSVEVEHLKLLRQVKAEQMNGEERDREIVNLLLARMIEEPLFSYQGHGEGHPIETCSSILIEALSNAYLAINAPEADDIYQVTVRRGTPADAYALLESFEWYPVGAPEKKYTEMSEDELAIAEEQNAAKRNVLVASMILEPVLSFNDAGAGYPVEALSEQYLKTLHEAHRIVNIPDAGLRSLQRQFRADADTGGTETGGESVGDDGG